MAKNYYINKLDMEFLIKNIKENKNAHFLIMNENTLLLIIKSGYYIEKKLSPFKYHGEEYFIFEKLPVALSWYLEDGEVEII